MRQKYSDDELIPGNKGKLREKYLHVANAEARLWLFKQMLDRDIATRDIQSFVEKQAGLRREFKQVDMNTLRVAMRAKYKDTGRHLKTLQMEIEDVRKQLLLDLDNKRYRLRKTTKDLRMDSTRMKENLIRKYKKKMDHLSGIQRNKMRVCGEKENREIRTITPQCLIKYENLSIFKPSHMFPKAKKSVGPFLGLTCANSTIGLLMP